MDLKRGKGNGKGIQKRSSKNTDHWAFLVVLCLNICWIISWCSLLQNEIEAPMWANLTLETQLLEQDTDDAWFRMEHPIHQMPSRHLKSFFPSCLHDKENSPKLLCLSPKLPDSVSRSRGKHYRSMQWAANQHPVRKLDAESLGMVKSKSVSGHSSASAVTTNSTIRRPPSHLVDENLDSNVKSILRDARSSSSSVISQYHSSDPTPSTRLLKKCVIAKPVNSKASCSMPFMASTLNSKGRSKTVHSTTMATKDQRPSLSRKSSSSKSSVGSSYTPGFKLERINSTAMLKEQRSMTCKCSKSSVRGQKMFERQFPDRNSTSKQLKKAADIKFVCQQELKSKVLGSAGPRKPLASHNETRPLKDSSVQQPRLIAGAGKLNQLAKINKENTTEEKIHHSTIVKKGTYLACTKGYSNQKANANGRKQDTRAVSKTFFR